MLVDWEGRKMFSVSHSVYLATVLMKGHGKESLGQPQTVQFEEYKLETAAAQRDDHFHLSSLMLKR